MPRQKSFDGAKLEAPLSLIRRFGTRRPEAGQGSGIGERFGIDRAVAFAVMGRGWAALSGLVTLMLLTRSLSRNEQGFYFLFNDILAMQVFFELGLAYVLVQFASHECAHLSWTKEGLLEGDSAALSRLASLLRLSFTWYSAVALLVALVLLPGGWLFFSRHDPIGTNVAWQWPWLWIVLVTCGSLILSPLLAVLEGCGLIAEITRIQVVQSIVGSLLFWSALMCHWGLATAPITNTVMFVGSGCWLLCTKRQVLSSLWRQASSRHVIRWKAEVWPLQWKMGLSWLSGYFIFRLFNIIVFTYRGPAEAGRLGLSLAVATALGGVALAWISTKSAPFGMLIAQRNYAELDRRFFPCLWQSLGVLVSGCILIWFGDLAIFVFHSSLRLRVLEPLPMALLLGATVITHIVFAEAVYLRAHKQEPLLVVSLVWGVLAAGASFILGRQYGATGMMFGYFMMSLIVGLGGGTWVFVKKRALWHAPDALSSESVLNSESVLEKF